ncbi:MAG TPA: hypothetical protein PLV92_27600, partial [Pirellulaceae bacterium]|nr:hypothetical protein [Pirellulaceae bacterium]
MSNYSRHSLYRFALVAAFVVAFVGRAALTPSIGCGQDGQKADATGAGAAATGAGPRVDFAREVRPILAGHCWSCHGVDETTREASLRLDQRDAAVAPRAGSSPAITPGQPAKSLMVARMHDADPERRMPPAEAKKPLTPEQIAILERWIAQGADFA